ncbi:zupT [Symbiodinium pilosum]|uniref:ZupT protein n=1 Tax=Symbiodinium pilosum TaxID=2952 RepID=A0A812QI07_SYMPI|nr:zupT [Symbiodinium pilosum]
MVNLEHAGIAFLMVLVAGFATCVGASVIFFQRLVKLASKLVLAGGLAFSAGIMLYVSFIEIFQKAKTGFEDAGMKENHAYMAATACMFGGMLMMRLIAVLTHCMDPKHDAHEQAVTIGIPPLEAPDTTKTVKSPDSEASEKALMRMGLNTALAITLHNFPEGLAGMVAGLIDPSVGFTLTMAIAIHNLPEGLCIALPVYYSSGSRLKGFFLATLSGMSEPIGALIAWGIVASSGEDLNGIIYGILFGMVGGIMIMIVVLELLPTAHRYDPKDVVVTHSLVAGMLVMAASLILFMV